MSDPREPGEELGGRWQHALPDGRIQCDLCPRRCRLADGQRAFCFVRERRGDRIELTSFGRASGFCLDPIEKKPLNHFLPGTSVLSFGTAGCNLGCKFCQNWDISKATQVERLSEPADPESIAETARRLGAASVAFTYNDPVIFAELAIATARACRARGVRSVAVTAGYITPEARGDFFLELDAANIDLKAFTEGFYRRLCAARLDPVLDTLRYVKHETEVWLEITTLLIPGENDSPGEVARLSDWVLTNLGEEVPLHFTAFHPDYKLTQLSRTPARTCQRAREQALACGLKHVYTGNVRGAEEQSTYCAGCAALLVEREGYSVHNVGLRCLGAGSGECGECGKALAGVFDPAGVGAWGPRRVPVSVSS
jgi:pyruvate formate lyase activating enzyme